MSEAAGRRRDRDDEEVKATFKAALKSFLAGLDSNDRERLKALGVAAFDQYVTEVPGPNEFIKKQIRPGIETAIENAIADLCS